MAKVKLYHGKQIDRVGGRLFKCYLTITMLGRGMQRLTKKKKKKKGNTCLVFVLRAAEPQHILLIPTGIVTHTQ